jgi:hypothetical protein
VADGRYLARARSARMGQTSDGMAYAEVDLAIVEREEASGYVPRLRWRGWLTRGAIKRTFAALTAMGARMALSTHNNDEDDVRVDDPLDGVGSKYCRIDVVSIQCDEEEAEGRWRTFVARVVPS